MLEPQGEIKIDPIKLVAIKKGETIMLSLTELRVLALFIANKGKVVDRHSIHASMMTTTTGAFSNLVDVYVNYLRVKIGKELITTVRGKGYMYG